MLQSLIGRKPACIAFLLLLASIVYGIVAMSMSVTTDEPLHRSYGAQILHFHPDHGEDFDSQMPISALNALPGAVGSYLLKHHRLTRLATVLHGFRAARFPTILAALGLITLIYLWAFELFGPEAAFAAGILSVVSPTLIAHGTLTTTDTYHALGVLGALYFLRRFLLRPGWRSLCIAGLALALAQTTKPFALFLYPIACLAVLIAFAFPVGGRPLRAKDLLAFAAVAAAWLLLIINTAFCFDRTFVRLRSYRLESTVFTRIQQIPVLREVPVPLPYPYLQGLDLSMHNVATGVSFGNVYLLGNLGRAKDPTFRGFKSYYAIAVLFKEPIALQILFLCGLVWLCRRRSIRDFILSEGLLFASAALLVFWLSFMNRDQIGIRHILPTLAVEIIIAGAVFSNYSRMSAVGKGILAALMLWIGVSVGTYYPHMIPYMNEFNPDRRMAFKILADSNLDWGQDAALVSDYLDRNPDVAVNPETPIAGRVLLSGNRLTGVEWWNPSAVSIAKRYRPVAQVGYAHFLFVVPPHDLDLVEK